MAMMRFAPMHILEQHYITRSEINQAERIPQSPWEAGSRRKLRDSDFLEIASMTDYLPRL